MERCRYFLAVPACGQVVVNQRHQLRPTPKTPRDRAVALAISTSGTSENIVKALIEARRRGLLTIAMVGYGGGSVGEGLADHVIVSRSQNVPRIQEAQASAYHVLRELVELAVAT